MNHYASKTSPELFSPILFSLFQNVGVAGAKMCVNVCVCVCVCVCGGGGGGMTLNALIYFK